MDRGEGKGKKGEWKREEGRGKREEGRDISKDGIPGIGGGQGRARPLCARLYD